MSEPAFREFDPKRDRAALIDLLTGERWEFRVQETITAAEVEEELARGRYGGEDDITLMIELDGEVVGLVRADGVAEDRTDPQLDFRLREPARGRGIGGAALRRITDEIFTGHPDKSRIEGQTRADNVAMRRAFTRGGYVQEAVYRGAWPVHGEEPKDGIGYAILRRDWESGETTPLRWD